VKSRVTVVAAVAASTALAQAGCSSSSNGSSSSTSSVASTTSAPALSGSITVFAASSLTDTFTALGKSFEAAHPGTTVTFNFGSSGTLATQINQGVPADVFASAAPANMQTVISAANASSSTNFVKNSAVIATLPGNPTGIATVADLSKGGVKVAICVPTAPCGQVALAVFKNAGVTVTPTAVEADNKSTLAIIESKEVDAGMRRSPLHSSATSNRPQAAGLHGSRFPVPVALRAWSHHKRITRTSQGPSASPR
jgi:molybdate transport system substrate-binding protein